MVIYQGIICGDQMKISVNKLQIIRPENNPKKTNFDLDVDWHVDFKENDKSSLEYSCTIETSSEYPIAFKVNGIIGTNQLEDLMNVLPGMVFDNSIKMMLNLINLTKNIDINIKTQNNKLKSVFNEKDHFNSDYIKMHPCLGS